MATIGPGITIEGTMTTEEFLAVIRQIVREEIAKTLEAQVRRGWQAVKPYGPKEAK